MARYLRVVAEIARKDLLLAVRSKRRLNGAAVLALLVVVVFSFVFVRRVEDTTVVAQGALWVALVFAATLSLSRGTATEQRNAAIEGLLLAPVDRSAVYLGKVCSSTVFVTVVGWVTLGAVTVFLDAAFEAGTLARLVVVFPLAAVGVSAAGVLVTTLTLRSGVEESMLPVLLVPLLVPVVLAGTELTGLTGPLWSSGWLRILAVYDALVLVVGWVGYEFVVAD
jgi:heme exporter protein B